MVQGETMMGKFQIINIEAGMPTVAQAQKRLDMELDAAKRVGIIAVKIIHGYGSSGTGGKLKKAIRNILQTKKNAGKIKAYVPGEEWDIFNQTAREIIGACKEVGKDSDLNRFNSGVTFVLLS